MANIKTPKIKKGGLFSNRNFRDRRYEHGRKNTLGPLKRGSDIGDDGDNVIETFKNIYKYYTGKSEYKDLGRDFSFAKTALEIRDQLGEGQEVWVMGYGENAAGEYEEYIITDTRPPTLSVNTRRSVDPFNQPEQKKNLALVKAVPDRLGKQKQTCFIVKGGTNTQYLPLVTAGGQRVKTDLPTPQSLKELLHKQQQELCDPDRVSREIKEGRAVDDSTVPENQRTRNDDPTGVIDNRTYYA